MSDHVGRAPFAETDPFAETEEGRSAAWQRKAGLCVPMLLFFTLSATYEMGPLCVPQPPKGSPVPELAWPI